MLTYLVPLALIAVSIALMLGLWNMARGGPGNRSQQFMRWRVGLQFVAILLLVLASLWTSLGR